MCNHAYRHCRYKGENGDGGLRPDNIHHIHSRSNDRHRGTARLCRPGEQKEKKKAMKRDKIIEISADDVIVGSIIDNGDVTAVLKKTARGDLYYEAKKDAILPAYSFLLGIKQGEPK